MPISEYDAFGPWIYEIDEEHPVPKLFAPYLPQDESARLLFKIPRSIERRVATPDMDLYDYVAGAYEDHICILARREHGVERQWIAYSDIEALSLRRHFLAGTVTFYLKTGVVTLPFNTVSLKEMKRFTTYIRERILGAPCIPMEVQSQQQGASLSPLFTNMLRDLRAEGESPLLYAYQPSVSRVPQHGTRGILQRLRPAKMPATLHLLTPRELLILQQDAATGKGEKDKFIYHDFYLPIAAIRQIAAQPSGAYNDRTCAVVLANHVFSYPVETDNAEIAAFYKLLDRYVS